MMSGSLLRANLQILMRNPSPLVADSVKAAVLETLGDASVVARTDAASHAIEVIFGVLWTRQLARVPSLVFAACCIRMIRLAKRLTLLNFRLLRARVFVKPKLLRFLNSVILTQDYSPLLTTRNCIKRTQNRL
jgi:hypothetical protein